MLLGAAAEREMAMLPLDEEACKHSERLMRDQEGEPYGYKGIRMKAETVVIAWSECGDVTLVLTPSKQCEVENVMRISAQYNFEAKNFARRKTLIRVNGKRRWRRRICSVADRVQWSRNKDSCIGRGSRKRAPKLLVAARSSRELRRRFRTEDEGLTCCRRRKRAPGWDS